MNDKLKESPQDQTAEAVGLSDLLCAVYEIDGYGVILPMVQNYYPVESNGAGGYEWGFKYTSGVFEFFHYINREDAEKQRAQFIYAINKWYKGV